MKFLSSTQYYYPPPGGGEHSLRNLLLYLQEEEHDVAAAYVGNEEDPEVASYPLDLPRLPGGWNRNYFYSFPWKKHLGRVLEEEEPDYVITQLGLAPATVEVCQDHDVETIVLLINYDHLCISQFTGPGEAVQHSCLLDAPWNFRVQWPFFRRIKRKYRKALEEANHVFSNSGFMRDVTREQLGIESDVVYPFIDLERVEVEERDPEYITMVNPSRYKGGEIFVELAERLPDERFLALGTGEKDIMRRMQELDNVDQVDRVDEIRDIYAKTRLLLVPSQWPEPFGMVAVEARHNGIPVLVSGTGGLPEAVGERDMVVEDFSDLHSWKNKINRKDSFDGPPGDAIKFESKNQGKRMIELIGEA